MEITIKGAIDIQHELNKISEAVSGAFNLPTGFSSKPVTIRINNLILTERQRGLLHFLQVSQITGKSSFEYNDYTFNTVFGKFVGHDYDSGDKAEHSVRMI